MDISVDEAIMLLEKLTNVFSEGAEDLPECGICMIEMEWADGTVLAKCGHVFCKLCVPQFSSKKCPYCRARFDEVDVVDAATVSKVASKNKESEQ